MDYIGNRDTAISNTFPQNIQLSINSFKFSLNVSVLVNKSNISFNLGRDLITANVHLRIFCLVVSAFTFSSPL